MVEVVAIIACATIIIVIFIYSKDLLEGKRRTRIRAIEKESVRMQADISELNIECRQLQKKLPNSTLSIIISPELASSRTS